MTFLLSTDIEVGHKIKTKSGWRKVQKVNANGATVSDGVIAFGSVIHGWKRN